MMGKRPLAFAILLVSCVAGRAFGADFRVLDFGAPCTDIPALEAARGNVALDETPPSGFQFAFRTREMDRDAVVAYACREGRFFRGAYIFMAADEAAATAIYKALKARTTRERGPPSYDFASREHRQKMQEAGATLSRADTQVAFWDGPRSEAHASVAEPSAERGWRVSLSFTAEGHED